MPKPSIIKRTNKGAALTYSELDTNFQNLADATVSLTAGTGGTQVVADLNGNITLVAGTGITLTGNDTAKTITINSTSGFNTFSTIAISGQSSVVADSTADTLTLVAGSNITLTTNAATDAITISSTAVTDLVQDTTPQLGGNLDTNGKSINNALGRVLVQDELVVGANSTAGINIGYLAGGSFRIESSAGLIIGSEMTFGGSVSGPKINLGNGTNGGAVIIGKDDSPNDKIYLSDVVNINNLTSTQRTSLVNPQNGDLIYNQTTHKFQGYANGVWVDLH